MSISYTTTGTTTTKLDEVKLYPNPVINSLVVSSKNAVKKIEIFSMTGVLFRSEISNLNTIDVSNLSKGSYLVNVFTESGVYKQMVLIK